jgi:hypothetical protein
MKKLKGIKFKNTDGGYGYGPVAPAKECPPGTMHDRTRGGACVDIELLKKEGKLPYTPLDDYGYTPEPRLPEPTSQADCPNGTVFAPSYVGCPPGWPSQLGCQPRKQPAQCKELDFGPRSQADCPEGTTFTVFGGGKDDLGMPRVGQAMCLKSKSCEQQYADYLDFIKTRGPQIRIMQKTKEQFMAECEGKSATPTVQGNVQNSLQSLMDKNWLLPAIAIGVGVYLITRKS